MRAGLLDAVQRDEDKLAAVLGHEAAHVVARHTAEGVGMQLAIGGLAFLVCEALRGMWSAAAKVARCALAIGMQLDIGGLAFLVCEALRGVWSAAAKVARCALLSLDGQASVWNAACHRRPCLAHV